MLALSPPLISVLLLANAAASGEQTPRARSGIDERAIREGWSDRAELAFALAEGNAGSRSFGFRNTLTVRTDKNLFFLDAGGHRAANTRTERAAVGDADNVRVLERDVTTVTAERYFIRAKYDREIARRFYLFGSGGWERNRFSGIQGRSFIAAGVGNAWVDSPRSFWRTDYGIARIRQRSSVPVPPSDEQPFPALRTTSTLSTDFLPTARYENHTIFDLNLRRNSDYRLDMTNAISFRIVGKLALKASLQLLYANERAFVVAVRQLPTGQPTGEEVLVRADSLDSFVTVAFVVDF